MREDTEAPLWPCLSVVGLGGAPEVRNLRRKSPRMPGGLGRWGLWAMLTGPVARGRPLPSCAGAERRVCLARAAGQAARARAAAVLGEGGLVAVPTDTVYGVACLAQNSTAVEALYRLKGRPAGKPLAICLGDVEQVYRYCRVPVPEELLRDLLPGPVTLVLPRSDALNPDLNPFTPLVGVRVPNHHFLRELAKACDGPLALTSANVSERASSLTVTEFQELWPHLSLIIDGGPTGHDFSPESRLGSTVIDLSISGKYKVIRPGCALTQTLEVLASKYGLRAEVSGD